MYEYVVESEALRRAAEVLGRCRVIGLDTEGDSLYHYQERICLVQLTGGGMNWVVDPLAMADLTPLAPVLADPEVLKILHGADYDLVCLKRDFGLSVRPIFDTAVAARALGIARFSLGDLLKRSFDVTLDKRYQKADWSQRPLPQPLLDYAAADTRYLPDLYEVLRKELEARGRLEMVEEESERLTRREWTGRAFEPDDFLRIKGVRPLPPEGQRVARALAVARDQEARRLDQPLFKVLAAHDLIRLAQAMPKTPEDLARLFPRASHPIRRQARFWLGAIAQGIADRSPLPAGQPTSPKPRLSPAQRALLARLQAWRNDQAKTEGVEPAMVLTMEELMSVVVQCAGQAQPTAEMIRRLPFLREWQKRRYADALADLLARRSGRVGPAPDGAR